MYEFRNGVTNPNSLSYKVTRGREQMSLVVVRDSREIYSRLQGQEPSQERPHARISVRAPELDEQVRSDLQSDIQAVLERTQRRVQSAQPTAGRESLSDDQVREEIVAQFRSSQRPSAAQQQRPLSSGGIRVATRGLSLPPEHRRAFQSEVRQLVQERLGAASQVQTRPQVTVCGCPPFGWGGCCWPPAGAMEDLTQIASLLPPQGNKPLTIGLFFPWENNLLKGDGIKFQIWNVPTLRLPPTSIFVGLAIDPTFQPGQWAKEVTGWTTCQCTVQTDHVENASAGACWMTVNRSTVDTLGFRKAVFLGWHNCGYFGPTPEVFWNLLGGLVLTFDWISDGGGVI
jgi:hypothetical protein